MAYTARMDLHASTPCSSADAPADSATSRTKSARRVSSRDPFHMVLTSIAALSALALAGCGVASASAPDPQRNVVTATKATPPSLGTWDALCQHVADVSNLSVTRTDSPQNQLRFDVPARVVATDRAQAQTVAGTVCSLKIVPAGAIYYCPMDWGVAYALQFTLLDDATQTVDVDPWGCSWVALAGAHGPISGWFTWVVSGSHGRPLSRWTSSALWSALGTSMGLPHASRTTFAGTLPS